MITPETDDAPKYYFGDNRPSMETECVASSFARNLEIQRNMLLEVMQQIAFPRRGSPEERWGIEDIAEVAAAAIASVKRESPVVG